MAVYDTAENNRTWMTQATLLSLAATVDFSRHQLFVCDNASVAETKALLDEARQWFPNERYHVFRNETNVGTARAINQAWQLRKPDECAVKMDNDVVIHQAGWLDLLEECVRRDPLIGICGLKRKDCEERPDHECHWYTSELRMLRHAVGERWLVVEKVRHVMGTCQLYSPLLLDRIGYLYQMGAKYAFDDALAAARCTAAGFYSCFLPSVEIDHIDPGDTPYQQWKHKVGGEYMQKYEQYANEYLSGKRSVYHGPSDD